MNEKNSNDQNNGDNKAELTQLSELNIRARTYSTKFWQIPCPY